MNIVIPTRGRVGRQKTLQNLTPALRACVTLVCPRGEVDEHRRWMNRYDIDGVAVVVEPPSIRGIAPKRRWILEMLPGEKIIMLDDDLAFCSVTLEGIKIRSLRATPEQKEAAFAELWEKIAPDTPHAGFGVRQMNRDKQGQGWFSTRMLCSLGYHVPTVLREVVFDHSDTFAKEDMDITLQLFRAGYPNTVNWSFVTDQQFGSLGGCSAYRTNESASADSDELARRHPGYVRVVEKKYNLGVRREVVVSWQKALQDGLARRSQCI